MTISTRGSALDPSLVERLYRRADAARWAVPADMFREALTAGLSRTFPAAPPSRRELERYFEGLHLQDLALACACAIGNERAWEHFIAEHRPLLYRAADALDRSGSAREIADALYAELYGLRDDREDRGSLFRYFHGRSSLSTWLRAVLAQRYVDRLRVARRTSPIDDAHNGGTVVLPQPDPDRLRLSTVVGDAMRTAISRLDTRDRLRLRLYYEEDLTLAQVGRVTGEHEATVSRQIAKSRKRLRKDVEQRLRGESRMTEAEIASCCASVVEDAGALDIRELFGSMAERKNPVTGRSK